MDAWWGRLRRPCSPLCPSKKTSCKPSRSPLGGALPFSSSSAAVDRQHDVPSLLLRFDIPGRLDHVLQWIAPIDDRPVSPGLDDLFKEEDVLLRVSGWYL